jgi:uncharacterized protein (DUF2147 family)
MVVLALIAALAAQTPAASDPNSIEGTWRSPGGNSIMKIAACGDAPCGTVAWASDKAKKDSARAAPNLVGTQLLTNVEQRPDGSWLGKLFIPDKNMRVTAKIQRQNATQLKFPAARWARRCARLQSGPVGPAISQQTRRSPPPNELSATPISS